MAIYRNYGIATSQHYRSESVVAEGAGFEPTPQDLESRMLTVDTIPLYLLIIYCITIKESTITVSATAVESEISVTAGVSQVFVFSFLQQMQISPINATSVKIIFNLILNPPINFILIILFGRLVGFEPTTLSATN